MVYDMSFDEIRSEIHSLNAQNKARQIQVQKTVSVAPVSKKKLSEKEISKAKMKEKAKKYPVEGKSIYRGPVSGAPYASLKLQASAVHKMPGLRARWIDVILRIWNKKMEYMTYFFKGFITLGISLVMLLTLPLPYTYLGFAVGVLAFMWIMMGHNHRIACWEYEMNMGFITGITYEPSYHQYKYWGKDKVLGK